MGEPPSTAVRTRLFRPLRLHEYFLSVVVVVVAAAAAAAFVAAILYGWLHPFQGGLPHATRCAAAMAAARLLISARTPGGCCLNRRRRRESGTGMAGASALLAAPTRTRTRTTTTTTKKMTTTKKDAAGHGGDLPALVALRVPGVDQRLDITAAAPRAAPRLRARSAGSGRSPRTTCRKSIASAARSCAPILATPPSQRPRSAEFAAVATAVMLLVARRSTRRAILPRPSSWSWSWSWSGKQRLRQWDERAEAEERQHSHEQWNDAKAEEVAVVEEVAAGGAGQRHQ